jgi:hypothetical protein
MRCGHCGGDTCKIYQADGFLVAECDRCQNTSHINVTLPKIVIDWGENSNGILYVPLTPKKAAEG